MSRRTIRQVVTSTILGSIIMVMLLASPAQVARAGCLTKLCLPSAPDAPAVTFFNPNDGRVDGLPTDELVVWCNNLKTGPLAQTIDVWRIDDNGVGQRMALFTFSEIKNAGDKPLVRTVDEYTLALSFLDRSAGLFYMQCNDDSAEPMMSKTFKCPSDPNVTGNDWSN